MKKFLVLIVLFLGIAISVNAQVQTYRTTGYYEKKLYSWLLSLSKLKSVSQSLSKLKSVVGSSPLGSLTT